MCQTALFFEQHLSKTLENATKIENNHYIKDNMSQILLSLIQVSYMGQYGSNRIVRVVSWLEFARNITKCNIDWTIFNFDKDWSKFAKWTTWISPYCPWLKFFKNISCSKKELLMEIYVETSEGQYDFKPYFILIYISYICFW